jgi:BolA protein
MIYGALSEELQAGLHALSLVTKTPEEIAVAATTA